MTRRYARLVGLTVLAVAVVRTPSDALQETPTLQQITEVHMRADAGDAAAQFLLGLRYGTGEGVIRDEVEAVRWYRSAAEQGYVVAQLALGVMYDDGHGVAEDATEAVRWFYRAAAQSVVRTQYDSRVIYANSREVAQDDVTIHLWFDLAVARSTGDIRDSVVQSRETVAQRMTRNQITEARRRAPTGAGKSSHWTAFLPAVEF